MAGKTEGIVKSQRVNQESEKDNSLQEFQDILKEAIGVLNYPDQVFDFIKTPMRFLEVSIPVQMDNGETRMFQGYRAQHNDAMGPTKGGIRFHPDVTPEEVKALAGWMSLKCG